IGPAPVPATHHRSWFVYVIRLSNTYTAEARDALMARLQAAGIGCAPYFPCIHLQPYYRQRFGYRRGDFPEAERVADRTLALPFFPTLDIEAQAYVVAQIREALPQLPRRTTTASVRQTG
ncbi:MAG: DegT/DnrJ/EryC1/StrS family aminotransferase, partial [Bacteroidota bacterium]